MIEKILDFNWNIIIAIFNIALIIIIIKQFDESLKAIITTKILPAEKEFDERPNLRETIESGPEKGYFHVYISNTSNKNVAKNLVINTKFEVEEESSSKSWEISHLNPDETARILLPTTKMIREIRGKDFDDWYKKDSKIKKVKGKPPEDYDILKSLPNKHIESKLIIKVKWKSIFPLRLHQINDSYTVEAFEFKEKYKRNFDRYPVSSILNERNEIPIFKETSKPRSNSARTKEYNLEESIG